LSLVESCRAFVRLRALGAASENALIDSEREVAATTFVLARRRLQALELLTADERLAEAALGVRSTSSSRRSS
jgi:hypothetical protein